MLNPTITRGVISSVTMVTILGIVTTGPSKASPSTIAKETIAKMLPKSLVKGKIGNRLLRSRIKIALNSRSCWRIKEKFFAMTENQQERRKCEKRFKYDTMLKVGFKPNAVPQNWLVRWGLLLIYILYIMKLL